MSNIVSEGIEVAGQVADKIKQSASPKRGGGVPYKTILVSLGIVALVGYFLANIDSSGKEKQKK